MSGADAREEGPTRTRRDDRLHRRRHPRTPARSAFPGSIWHALTRSFASSTLPALCLGALITGVAVLGVVLEAHR